MNTEYSLKDWIKRTTYYASMGFVCLVLIWVPFQAALGSMGSNMEMRIIKPLVDFRFTQFVCVNEEDNLAYGVLNKTMYPLGVEAELIDMRITDTREIPRILNWRPATPDDPTPMILVDAINNFEIYIENGCNTEFTVQTIHRSPITDNELVMDWGPFNSSGTTQSN
jgi:hypothetical protein